MLKTTSTAAARPQDRRRRSGERTLTDDDSGVRQDRERTVVTSDNKQASQLFSMKANIPEAALA